MSNLPTAPIPMAPLAPTATSRIEAKIEFAAPFAALAATLVAGGLIDRSLTGAGAALAGIAAILAFDVGVVDRAFRAKNMADNAEFNKTHPAGALNPNFTPEARIQQKREEAIFFAAGPLALMAGGFAVHHFFSPEAGKLLMIAGGAAGAATAYVLLDGPLPNLFSK